MDGMSNSVIATRGRIAVALLAVASVTFSAGCSTREIRPPADAAAARATLSRALDAWKAGESHDQLRQAENAIYVGDEDWSRGRRLEAYEVIDEPVQEGGHWRVFVVLKLREGPERGQKVCYAVTPGSPASVIRSDFLD